MAGHIRRRGNRWVAMARIDGKLRWLGTFDTRREAQAKVTDILADVQRGAYVPPSKQTLGEFLEEWLPSVRHSLGSNTLSLYETQARVYVIPRLGNVKLRDVTSMRLNRLYSELSETLAPATVHGVHRFLRRALRDASLAVNPAAGASPPKVRRRPFTVWDAETLSVFLNVYREHRDHLAWLLLATTGMRRGECLALNWQDIDLDKAVLRVPDSKNGRGRQISLDATTVGELRLAHRGRGPVFPGESPVAFSRRFARAVEASGLPGIRLHDLRHSHATLLLQAGVHPKVVQERLGHTSIQVTLDIYSHVVEGMDQDAAEVFGTLLSANGLLNGRTQEASI